MFLILVATSVVITLISSLFLIDTGAGRIQEGRPITTIRIKQEVPPKKISGVELSERNKEIARKNLRPEALEIRAKITKTDKKVGDLIKADTADFKIIYLISNEQFLVHIKSDNYQQAKAKAEQWFKSQGFNMKDLCSLRITFGSLNLDNPPKSDADFLPTGCV